MKKILTILFIAIFICIFVSCVNSPESTNTNSNTIDPEIKQGDEVMKSLELIIGDSAQNVTWENNASVSALANLAKDGLSISMHKYGGFEQVGSLGQTIPSSDSRITTSAGDIVLYSSNQIVIFYGSNTWAYTKLGHINLTQSELTEMLGNSDITITLKTK